MQNPRCVSLTAMPCNNANAIPTRTQYAGTYTITIAGRYGWEGLRSQGMGCEWLAGFVYVWTVRMRGAGLRMISRVSVGGAGRSGAGLEH